MFQLYTPLFIVQAICLYHAYTSNADQRWYWLIIFIPGIGCAIYLYHHFANRKNVHSVTEGLKEVVNSNYRIEQLEKAVRFSATVQNRINLADAYVTYSRFGDAIAMYNDCMNGYLSEDTVLRMKLLNAYFLNNEYSEAVKLGQQLIGEKAFRNSTERIAYAWSLHRVGESGRAAEQFRDMDHSFTNYRHRLEYCRYLIEIGEQDALRERLSDLREEIDHMKGPEKRLHRDVVRDIRDLHSRVNSK